MRLCEGQRKGILIIVILFSLLPPRLHPHLSPSSSPPPEQQQRMRRGQSTTRGRVRRLQPSLRLRNVRTDLGVDCWEERGLRSNSFQDGKIPPLRGMRAGPGSYQSDPGGRPRPRAYRVCRPFPCPENVLTYREKDSCRGRWLEIILTSPPFLTHRSSVNTLVSKGIFYSPTNLTDFLGTPA